MTQKQFENLIDGITNVRHVDSITKKVSDYIFSGHLENYSNCEDEWYLLIGFGKSKNTAIQKKHLIEDFKVLEETSQGCYYPVEDDPVEDDKDFIPDFAETPSFDKCMEDWIERWSIKNEEDNLPF